MADYCGTGSGNFPKPGDPNLNSPVLSAAPAFGGIDVTWTYPDLNPQAVAHTILYRSTSADPVTRVRHAIVTGDFFYDRPNTATLITYFYWIQMVSVNGTIGDLLGPVSATARPTILQTMEMLTGQIDDGALAQALKSKIGEIDSNKSATYAELAALAQADDSLGVAFSEVQAQSDGTRALLQEEVQARTSADSSTISQVNTLYAQSGEDIAAVQADLGAFVTTVNGDLEAIGAHFTVKTDVNGVIGGFGLYNDGTLVEAGFDVDRFWVGRSDKDIDGNPIAGSSKGVKPFIIEGDESFIKEAMIQKLTFNKLRSADGSFIVDPVTTRIKANYIQADQLEVVWGKIQNVQVQSGDIVDGAITNLKIGDTIQSSNFSTFSETGWRILKSGAANFYDVVISRPNIVASGIWINPYEGSSSTSLAAFHWSSGQNIDGFGSDAATGKVLAAKIASGYSETQDIRNSHGASFIVKARALESHIYESNSGSIPSTGKWFDVEVPAEVVISCPHYSDGSGGVPGGDISILLYIALRNIHSELNRDAVSIRIDRIEWALARIT